MRELAALPRSSHATGNNVVCVFQFVLPYAITVSRIVFAKGGTAVAGSHANFGIYDMSRNRLIDSGQFDTSSGGASVQSNSITAVPLLPGAFYFAQAATDSTVTCALNAQNITVSVMSTFRNQNSPANNARQGTAANALSGGVLPSSLGNITAFANRAPVGILFEP